MFTYERTSPLLYFSYLCNLSLSVYVSFCLYTRLSGRVVWGLSVSSSPVLILRNSYYMTLSKNASLTREVWMSVSISALGFSLGFPEPWDVAVPEV